MVVADAGVEGLVLQVAIAGVRFDARGDRTAVCLGAGEEWDNAVAASVSRGLAGLECLSGIPGFVGGTPVQNVGAYGQEVAETIEAVTVLDRQSGEVGQLSGVDCQFRYRSSRFKREDSGRFVVCEVTYELRDGSPTVAYPDVIGDLERRGIRTPSLVHVRDSVLSIRRRKGMVVDVADPDTRSVGSFFMNPVIEANRHAALASSAGLAPGFTLSGGQVKVPAAWLIEQSGFTRGYAAGAVGLSTKHPLAIINRGGATARDVVVLARRIKQQVVDRFDIWLHPEPTFIGFGDDADVTFLEKAHG
jgi:UDP-N-acetylmuramate dehydrogenase